MNEKDVKVLVKIKVGSNLYGTNGPDSDTDYKGVFLPSFDEVVLGNQLGQFPKSIKLGTGDDTTKNTADDIDYELYSLQYYLCLLQKGDTGAVELLFAPDEMIEITSPEWEYLRTKRKIFITKEMKSFLGYCRTQASKYSAKGGRIAALRKVIDFMHFHLEKFKEHDGYIKSGQIPVLLMSQIWEDLPEGEYIRKFVEPRNNANMFEVCGRKFDETASVKYVYDQLQKVIDGYGNRAKQAENSKGVDWKAVSHAFRVGYQLKELMETGDLKFPLKDSKFFKQVKFGKLKFKEDKLEDKLEQLLIDLEKLTEESEFREKVNIKPLCKWVVNLYIKQIMNEVCE